MKKSPYIKYINNIVNDTSITDLILVDCNCKTKIFPDKKKPEYFKAFKKAVRSWANHAIHVHLYWSVHLNEKHIIHVKNRYQLSVFGIGINKPGSLRSEE